MLSKDQIGSPSTDEGRSGGSIVGGGGSGLKKGPWTSAEDAVLVEYVKKHGEGSWNAVQKHSGLSRCGKSCRLRWANHLRPNLKKGAFTEEEENIIIELHAIMGNKWAKMATRLPGRTDNEIKNYWNTRKKRRLRAGLPIYPPNLSFSSSNENNQGQDFVELSSDDNKMQDGYDIPDYSFNGYYNASYLYPYEGSIPGNNFSTSKPLLGALKPELPSLQTESPSSWLEADAYIEPPPALSTQSECSNSGLLEEVLHESQALLTGQNCSAMTPSDLTANNFDDETELSNAIAALEGDDGYGLEHKPVMAGGSPAFADGLWFDSLFWNNTPRVCQLF